MSCDVLKPIEIFFSLFFNVYKMRRNIDVIFAKCNRWPWMDIPGVWIIIIGKKALVIFCWFWFYLIKFWDAGLFCFSWCFYFLFCYVKEILRKGISWCIVSRNVFIGINVCIFFPLFPLRNFNIPKKISLNNTWNMTT